MSPRDSPVATWEDWTAARVRDLEARRLLRSLRPVEPCAAPGAVDAADLEGGGGRPPAAATTTTTTRGSLLASSPRASAPRRSRGGGGGGGGDRPPPLPALSPVHVRVPDATLRAWLADAHDLGETAFAAAAGSSSRVGGEDPPPSRVVRLFSSNDYLGLSAHPSVRLAAADAALRLGAGPRSSALVCGYTHSHRALESAIARLKKTEECLLFPTGHAANVGVLPALCEGHLPGVGNRRSAPPGSYNPAGSPGGSKNAPSPSSLTPPAVEIFSDALNHASIVDGCRLAARNGAKVTTYPHRDADDTLEALLDASEARLKIIVTDSLFSVDGDFAPLRKLAALKKNRGGARAGDDTLLVVDEAHATLAMGATGAGAAEAMGVDPADVDVSIGTLSKAFGSHGGFAATSRAMKSFLLSRARAQVFSTALPAPCVEAAAASLQVSNGEEGRALRKRLWANVATLNEALVAGSTGSSGGGRLPPEEFFFDDGFFSRSNAPSGGYDGYASRRVAVGSPIAALRVGGGFGDGSSEAEALRCSRALLERHGAHVVALRPPTVPAGTSRIRVALSAAHSDEDVRALVEGLRDVGLGFGGGAGRAKM